MSGIMMDIAGSELTMPQNLLPSPEPPRKNEALTIEGVPEAQEAGKHDQNSYESAHPQLTRKVANTILHAKTPPSRSGHDNEEEAVHEEGQIPKSHALQVFDDHGHLSSKNEAAIVDVLL
jgi:hypothetical protein